MKVTGPRGIMRAIPPDADRRQVLLQAIERLLAGGPLTRRVLFCDHAIEKWSHRILERMRVEGAIVINGNKVKRTYAISDKSVLMKFRELLNEKDPVAQKHGYGNTFEVTPELKALLDGLLLGDGHYSKDNSAGLSCAFSMSQRLDRLEWLKFVEGSFSKHGIISDIQYRKACSNVMPSGKTLYGKPSAFLRTKTYRTFRQERLRWYPDGVKIVPKDVDLGSPLALAQWYMGDGCLCKSKSFVSLSTCGFGWDDIEWLRCQLMQKHGIASTVSGAKSYPNIVLYSRNAEKFIQIVRPFVLSCFSYKVAALWKPNACKKCSKPIKNRDRRTILCDDCARPCDLRKRGTSLRPLAAETVV